MRRLARRAWNKLLFSSPLARRMAADAFHVVYHRSPETWMRNRFLGVPIQQCPLDLHAYQEVVSAVRPACVLQTGVASGGSLLYFAALLDLTGAPPEAVVVGVDVRLSEQARSLTHPRLRLIEGDSGERAVAARVREAVGERRGMVVLDSDHRREHVLRELELYAGLVAVGSFLVVEDANINGHPVAAGFGPGPREAVEEFVRIDGRFVRDDSPWRRHGFSFHQGGWLRCVR